MNLSLGVDTFISVEDADKYMDARLNTDDWQRVIFVDSDKKLRALRMATAMISRERFAGRITSTTQALAWPRAGVTDQEGRVIPSDTIPAPIAQATAELALFLLRYDITDDRIRRGVFSLRSEQIGDSMQSYDSAGSNENSLPAIVRDMIAPFLASGSGCSARLIQ